MLTHSSVSITFTNGEDAVSCPDIMITKIHFEYIEHIYIAFALNYVPICRYHLKTIPGHSQI